MRLKLLLGIPVTALLVTAGVPAAIKLAANLPPCSMEASLPDSGAVTVKFLRTSTKNSGYADYLITNTLKWESKRSLDCFHEGKVDWAFEQNINYQQGGITRKVWDSKVDEQHVDLGFYPDITALDGGYQTAFDFGFFRPGNMSPGREYRVSQKVLLPTSPSRSSTNSHSFEISNEVLEINCPPLILRPHCVGLRGERGRSAVIETDSLFGIYGETCWSWAKARESVVSCGSSPGTPDIGPSQQSTERTPTVHLTKGPAAPRGFWYGITLTGFSPSTDISVVCFDSVDRNGFYPFRLKTDSRGGTRTQSHCYSGDGPDHWVTANGIESNHITWAAVGQPPPSGPSANPPAQPGPAPPAPPRPNPTVTLAQGPPAPSGFRYAVTLNHFSPNATVTVTCHDSVDPGGFYTFTLRTDGNGYAYTASYCYSADGPDHWVKANGTESNHVTWGGAPAPPPPPPGPSVSLAKGPVAPTGYRYAVTLQHFTANSNVTVTCHDSVDPGGFYTFTLRTDGNGYAYTASYCYSADGPDHWVKANGTESNHVIW
ncbi:MAG TPA: hypothetical protein VFM55_04470 [Micromonosporaceae bacterium]|nr:hypothetical protein [Micromonosporaceae bacterium]